MGRRPMPWDRGGRPYKCIWHPPIYKTILNFFCPTEFSAERFFMDIIFDVDGTLMDIEHRRHFVTQRPKDFKSFREHTKFDTRKEDVFAIADSLQAQGHRILISTGRIKSEHDITVKQIRDGGIDFEKIYMRSDTDYRPDDELKEGYLEKMRRDGYTPTIAFDDRQRVVDMFRSKGLTVFQVDEGDF